MQGPGFRFCRAFGVIDGQMTGASGQPRYAFGPTVTGTVYYLGIQIDVVADSELQFIRLVRVVWINYLLNLKSTR